MATRIEIELTSARADDGTFTWRAAGARVPKGSAPSSLFPDGAGVGDVFRVELDVDIDGTEIAAVLPPKGVKKPKEGLLELISTNDEPLITQELAPKGRGRGGDRDGRRGGGKGRGRGRDGDSRGRGDGDSRRDSNRGGGGGRGGQAQRPPKKPKLPPKPKPPRLSAGKAHRKALLESLSADERVIAEQLLQGGLQGIRKEVAKQNEENKAAGRPEVGAELLRVAEKLLPRIQTADWHDKADAALEGASTIDLRDLRSVVTAGETNAKNDETRELAAKLRVALNDRLEADHQAWIAEIIEMLDDDRAVRALHLSSRPPKAGAPLPPDVATRLVEAANATLTAETSQDRWGYVIEALSLSPIRAQVVPQSLPEKVSDELKATIARFGDRLPDLAHIFGITPDPKSRRKGPRKAKPKPPKPERAADAKDGSGDTAKAEPASDEPKAESTVGETAAPAESKAESAADEPKAESNTEQTPAAAEPKADETAAPAESTAATGDAAPEPEADAPEA